MSRPNPAHITPVHIVGQPGSGKTTLTAALTRHFTSQGLTVGTLKHSSHTHELDKPGKDSHVHRTAGASPAGMITANMAALYFPASERTRPDHMIREYYGHADIVLIEGWISGPYPKIEIWRKAVGQPPLFPDLPTVMAVASNDRPPGTESRNLPVLPLEPVAQLANFIQGLIQ